MKIHYMSDLHLEFGALNMPLPKGEVLILAGDIISAIRLCPTRTDKFSTVLRERFHLFFEEVLEKFDKCFYVTGNHEYYNSSFEEVDEILDKYLPSYITRLNDNLVEYKGFSFFGGTLWTGFPNYEGEYAASTGMNDFRFIDWEVKNKGMNIRFTTGASRLLHTETVMALKKACKGRDNVIIVTHHCPSFECINDKHVTSPLNDAYCTNLHGLIEAYKPIAWICGHTHNQKTIKVHDTEIRMNCRGYMGYESCADNFDPDTYFEV